MSISRHSIPGKNSKSVHVLSQGGFRTQFFFQIHRANWGCACADASAINHRPRDLNSIYYCRKSPFFTVLLIRHSTGITISNNKRLWEASQNWNLLYLSKIETLEKNSFSVKGAFDVSSSGAIHKLREYGGWNKESYQFKKMF